MQSRLVSIPTAAILCGLFSFPPGAVAQWTHSGTGHKLYPTDYSNDSVGIGTASPAYRLDVAGDINVSTGRAFRVNGIWTLGADGSIVSIGSQNTAKAVGIYSQGNSTPAFYGTTGGWVGMGTASPTAKLDIKHNSDAGAEVTAAVIRVRSANDASGRGTLAVGRSDIPSSHSVFLESNDATTSGIAFRTRDASGIGNRMVISAAGSVGIGTTSPGTQLSVQKATGNDAIGIYDGSATLRLSFGQEASYTGNYIDSRNIDLKLKSFLSGGTGGNIILCTGDGSASERVRLDRNGNLGIGTTSPSRKLHVSGAVKADTLVIGSQTVIESASSLAFGNIKVGSHTIADADGYLSINGNDLTINAGDNEVYVGGDLYTTSGGSIKSDHDLIADDTVFVGGTSGAKLWKANDYVYCSSHLVANNKNVYADTAHVDAVKINNWTIEAPDYVFSDSYRLKSLREVEQFVKTNKHLPDIKSAARMKAEGVDLAEMNMALLKKVEELTLYVIQQNREIEKLKAKVR